MPTNRDDVTLAAEPGMPPSGNAAHPYRYPIALALTLASGPCLWALVVLAAPSWQQPLSMIAIGVTCFFLFADGMVQAFLIGRSRLARRVQPALSIASLGGLMLLFAVISFGSYALLGGVWPTIACDTPVAVLFGLIVLFKFPSFQQRSRLVRSQFEEAASQARVRARLARLERQADVLPPSREDDVLP